MWTAGTQCHNRVHHRGGGVADTIVLDEPVLAGGVLDVEQSEPEALVVEELLVEEVSIDGMCGVY
jgi:mycofactocin precursor